MSVWTKRIALYLNVDSAGGPPLLSGKSSSVLSSPPVFTQGDRVVRLELWFRSLASSPLNASTVAELEAGSQIAVAAKEATKLDAATVLFSAFNFAKDGAGDDVCYWGILDLNTVEANAWFADNDPTSLAIKVDARVENADDTERLTFQFDATLRQRVYDNEPPTTPGTPPFYNAAECEARFVPRAGNKAWIRRYDNGDGDRDWYYDPVTQLWYPQVMVTGNGVRSIVLGQEGIAL